MSPCPEKAAASKGDFYGLWHKDEAGTLCPRLCEDSLGLMWFLSPRLLISYCIDQRSNRETELMEERH